MSDVHYYLSGWTPTNRKEEDYFNCVGANFPITLPGYYKLPFNEGSFTIDKDAVIHMNTRGNSCWYEHPIVTLGNVTKEINYGFYAHVASEGHTSDFLLYTHKGTGFSTNKCI